MNKVQTYFLTGKILSLDWQPQNRDMTAFLMKTGNLNWKGLMQLGSDNLILPSLNLALRRHSLEYIPPAGFMDTLEEITDLNRERNNNIRQLLAYVAEVLSGNNIKFVVMKGVGNMMDGLYHDRGERITYDLDILVEPEKMVVAAGLLLNEGFFTQKRFNPSAVASTMHYPILLREDFMAGVEIHCQPVPYLYENTFASERVFRNSTWAANENNYKVMDHKDRIIHNFLHSQLMHHGHHHASVSLRDLYDLLLLSSKENLWETFEGFGYFQSKYIPYLKLFYRVFDLDMPAPLKETNTGDAFIAKHYKVLTLSKKGLKRHHLMWLIAEKYLILPLRMPGNRRARNYIISRITDLKWYRYHFDAMKRAFRTLCS